MTHILRDGTKSHYIGVVFGIYNETYINIKKEYYLEFRN